LAKSTNADVEKRYVVDGMNTVVEQDAGGFVRYKYIYANGMLLARIDTSGNKYYYHHDGLGTIVGMSNESQAITTSMLFDDLVIGFIGYVFDGPLSQWGRGGRGGSCDIIDL